MSSSDSVAASLCRGVTMYGERTRLACWLESPASRYRAALRRRLAETTFCLSHDEQTIAYVEHWTPELDLINLWEQRRP